MSCAACADRNVSSVQSVAFGCRWPTICSLEWPRPRKHHHHNNSNNNNNNNEEEEEEEEAGNGYGQLSHQVANGETFHTQREREREREKKPTRRRRDLRPAVEKRLGSRPQIGAAPNNYRPVLMASLTSLYETNVDLYFFNIFFPKKKYSFFFTIPTLFL